MTNDQRPTTNRPRWYVACSEHGMRAGSLEDLRVFRQTIDAAGAVAAIASRGPLCRDSNLSRQLLSASAAVPAHIAEGFGQKTDRHFAHYLYIARGGCNEVRAHLTVAAQRRYISDPELVRLSDSYVVVGKMLTRLIQHLERSDRKQRG